MKKFLAAAAISAGLMISAQVNAGGTTDSGGGPKVAAFAPAASAGYFDWLFAALGL
jgi:hypothetical protein